jgi:hypothetical protein
MPAIQTKVAACIADVSTTLLEVKIAAAGFTVPQWSGVAADAREYRMVMILQCIDQGSAEDGILKDLLNPDFTHYDEAARRECMERWPRDDDFYNFLMAEPLARKILSGFLRRLKGAKKDACLAVCEESFDMYAQVA